MIFQPQIIESLKKNSENTAIEQGDKKMSYATLLSTANKISQFLLDQKLEKETAIGILLSDRCDLICSLIGVMNAGCVFVPIDEELPEHRLQELIKDIPMEYIITSKEKEQLKTLGDNPPSCFYLQDILTTVADLEVEKMEYPDFAEDDSLYLYFTSGSTGKPKGVLGRNKSLSNFIQWELSEFSIDETFRCSQFVSPYFDAFLRDVFVPLMAGGTICIPPTGKDFFDSETMIAWIDQQKINLIHCVPSLFRLFNTKDLPSTHFAELKYVLLSGEKIIPAELKNWYEKFADRIQLVNLYGTTEATMISSFYRIKASDVTKPKIAIGKAISNTQLQVLNKEGKPCNQLMVGYLWIVSDVTSKGYCNAPELTAEKFIKTKDESGEEKIAYKTGDKARILFDGTIELLGREDRQVKLRGIRVDLEQMEHLLFQHEWVKNAAVIMQEEDPKAAIHQASLIAFVVGEENRPKDLDLAESAEHFLAKHLSATVMPANIVVMDQFPLLSNGKVSHKELLASLKEASRTIVEPANETETALLGIWQEILGEKDISTEDAFNRIGGNSLSIMRLISRIYKSFQVRIALSDIFKNLTIQKQAQYIAKASQDNLLSISKAAEKPHYHLSAAQQRIYFNYKLDPTTTSYNIPMAWEIKGAIDQDKVEDILNTIVQRHESLRTEFKLIDGKPFQFVKEEVSFKLERLEETDLEIGEAIHKYIRPFDLANAPLIRSAIIQVKEGRQLIIIDIHHIVCDGMSQVNLYTEFLGLFEGQYLQPLAIQYKDYAEWETQFRTTETYSSYREFWLKNFEGAIPTLSLPIVDQNAGNGSDAGGNVDFQIARTVLDPILQKLKEKEISTYSGLFSLFFMYLSQLSGQDDIVIGTNTSGRTQLELEEIIGMLTKTLPIRQQMNPESLFTDFAKQMHDHLIQATSRQVFDLIDIVAELNQNNPTPVESLFSAMLVFQNYKNEHQQPGEVTFSRIDLDHLAAKYPITMYAVEEADHFSFRMEYLASYFTSADAELLCHQFTELVKTTSQNLEARISEIITGDSQSYEIAEEEIDFNF